MAGKKAAAAEQKLPETAKLPLSFYFWQHIGFVIAGFFVFLLAYYYEDPPIANKTNWCLVCLGGCLIGLLFHEFRPFKAWDYYEEQKEQQELAATKAQQTESKKSR